MVQAIDNPIAANFLTNAVVEHHNFSQLNKTRIRFRIQLNKSTKSAVPKWADVLKAEVSEIESDLVKVINSEVGFLDKKDYPIIILLSGKSIWEFSYKYLKCT